MVNVAIRRNNTKPFGELSIGDLFFSEDGFEYVFQKTIPVIDREFPDDEDLNAVMVIGDETGNIIHFDDTDRVVTINNGTLIVTQ